MEKNTNSNSRLIEEEPESDDDDSDDEPKPAPASPTKPSRFENPNLERSQNSHQSPREPGSRRQSGDSTLRKQVLMKNLMANQFDTSSFSKKNNILDGNALLMDNAASKRNSIALSKAGSNSSKNSKRPRLPFNLEGLGGTPRSSFRRKAGEKLDGSSRSLLSRRGPSNFARESFSSNMMNEAEELMDDTRELPNHMSGQSIIQKQTRAQKDKGKTVKFEEADENDGHSEATSKSQLTIQKELAEKSEEEKLKDQYQTFYPIYRQMHRLLDIKDQNHKIDGQELFVNYLESLKESEALSKERQKAQHQEFYEQLQVAISQQTLRTKELMSRLRACEEERTEKLNNRMARLGQQMLANFQGEMAQHQRLARQREAAVRENRLYFNKPVQPEDLRNLQLLVDKYSGRQPPWE